ncbi:hypothetical protein [Pseudomonas palmensis]|uniref:hypothetical protein n=1 Tax=Pseudomonas palmensis TaxID=2815362 RepID=UPI001AE92E21|nr:hypothetical protein [Pseudomonas palmensis]
MVTDKFTLDLLPRLADAQLALASSMNGVSSSSRNYPEDSLRSIAEALDAIDVLLLEVSQFIERGSLSVDPELH